MSRFNFKSAVIAGIIATAVMTVVMYFMGMHFMMMLGNAFGLQGISASVVGGIVHFLVGIFYALIYGLFFEPLFKNLPKFLSGAIYSLLPFILAITLAPSVLNYLYSTFGSKQMPMKMDEVNPEMCAPCQMCEPSSGNMYGCCPEYSSNFENTSSILDQKEGSLDSVTQLAYACYPCGPSGNNQDGYYPCEPCYPCGMSGKESYMCRPQNLNQTEMSDSSDSASKGSIWLWSLIIHLVYGIALGLAYMPKPREHSSEHEGRHS